MYEYDDILILVLNSQQEKQAQAAQVKKSGLQSQLDGLASMFGFSPGKSAYSDFTINCGSCCKSMCCVTSEPRNSQADEVKLMITDLKQEVCFELTISKQLNF